ncbi:MAG: hypothetical protein LUG12_09535 [Erysipelotrichaceae bacterium]|nr:hypothetical protein [Erysipelotrichaceae bacterium]
MFFIVKVAGHGVDYWLRDKKIITSEAFANMFECQFDDERHRMMKKIFLRSLEYFELKLNYTSKNMSEELTLSRLKFSRVFDYCSQCSPVIDFDQKEYEKELEKCVEYNFDYTIENTQQFLQKN